jgi:hypothetical protein
LLTARNRFVRSIPQAVQPTEALPPAAANTFLFVSSALPSPLLRGAQQISVNRFNRRSEVLDIGPKNLLASLCLSRRKAQIKNEDKLHDRA